MSQLPKSDFFVVGPVRLSYTDGLFTAQSVNGSDPKFGCNILIADPAVAQQIEAHVEQVGSQAFGQEWQIPNKCRRPLRDVAEKPNYAGQALCFAGVSSRFQVSVAGPDHQPILNNAIDPVTGQKQIYGGVWAYVSINVYAYRHPQGGPGVSLGINAVLKVGDGEPLIEGGQVDIQKTFAGIPTTPPAGALPPGQAPMGQFQVPQGSPQNFGVPGQDPLAYQPQAPQGQPQAPQYPQAPQGQPQAPQYPQAPQGQPQGAAPQAPGGYNPQTGQYVPPIGS